MEIRKEYDKLKEKYGLPSYDELDSEFELFYIQNIMEIRYPLRFIRRRLRDKAVGFANFLQGLLQPNPASLISLEESKFFTDDDKKKIGDLVRNLMKWESRNIFLDVEHDEKSDAEFIKGFYKEWINLKKEIKKVCNILEDGWTKGMEEEKKGHYFG